MSIQTNYLTDDAFRSTMAEPMKAPPAVGFSENCNIWQYIEAIPDKQLSGFSLGEKIRVEVVYRTGDLKYDHVLIPTLTANVYLVIVIELSSNSVFGHHLLKP